MPISYVCIALDPAVIAEGFANDGQATPEPGSLQFWAITFDKASDVKLFFRPSGISHLDQQFYQLLQDCQPTVDEWEANPRRIMQSCSYGGYPGQAQDASVQIRLP